MKKIRLLLAILVASIGSVQGAWARTAPTFPEAQTLESGKTYYLYNVGSERFIYRSGDDERCSTTTKSAVFITDLGDGTYTIQYSSNNYYFYATNERMQNSSSPSTNYRCFRFTQTDGGYYIQRNYNYNETQYLVDDPNCYYVRTDHSSGNIVWQLLKVDETDRYYAKKALYDALEAATGYEFAIAEYETIYANEASTNEELNAAATALNKSIGMSKGYKAPWWNERPILFYTADGNFGQSEDYTWALTGNNYTTGHYFKRYLRNSGATSSISATVLIEVPSTLIYSLSNNPPSLQVYVDDVLVRSLGDEQCNHYPSDKTSTRFFEELSPGLHKITWTVTALEWMGYADVNLGYVGIMASPLITVNLLEPGSLGTEVLYNTDHIKNVRRLKVKGAMNSDDWGRIKMMSTLQELDLSEALFTEIPANQFNVSSSDTTMNFLHKVALPEGLTRINNAAFYNSFVEDINFPSTLQSIGQQAFYMSHIREAILPDNLVDMGEGVFEYAYWLNKVHFGKNLTTIPRETFNNCYYLNDVTLPEKLRTVDTYGFHECHSLQTTLPDGIETVGSRAFEGCWNFYPKLPGSLKTIRNAAFNSCNALDSLIVPSSVTTIEEYAFCNCSNLKYAELSVEQYTIPEAIFDNTPKLDVIKLNSSTVVSPTISGGVYPHRNISQLTLQVPHYLVNSYKLHSYWYNAKAIEPFDYSTIDFIPIHGKLTLNHERFGGQPRVNIYNYNSYLKVNGEDAQSFNDFSLWRDYNDSYGYGMVLSNCPNLSIEGSCRVVYKTNAKKWNFISLPFDLDVSQISFSEGNVQYAIRYYDGAGRAANGKSGNWKNVDRTSIIPAGTGFILQTNVECWTSLYSADNESKQNMVACDEFTKTLAVNASETASNKGWNLVGNPYQCFYNNHCLNFTAPITAWNGSTYTAYSLTDDDYAIRPNEAFFVQCPNEEYNTIGFPLQGRQLTSVIESQNAARAAAPSERKLIDVELSDGELSDKTRFVMNPEAEMGYELNRDASKFFSMDAAVPQIYTIECDELLAINERPVGEGTVQVGFRVAVDGEYTITASRNGFKNITLVDNETGIETDLSTDGSYTFTASAGTNNSRFVLRVGGVVVTSVNEELRIKNEGFATAPCYNLNGQRIAAPQKGLYIVNGKKVLK